MEPCLKIWLVEDDESMTTVIRVLLKEHHPKVVLAPYSQGSEMLEALRTEINTPNPQIETRHVIITDVHLAGTSGFDLLQKVKADPSISFVPLLFLSGTPAQQTIAKAYKLGAMAYLVKPDELQGLEALLDGVVRFWSQVQPSFASP